MKSLQRLDAWLACPLYSDGLGLYDELIGGGFLLRVLQSGPDEYNQEALQKAFQNKRDELASKEATQPALDSQAFHSQAPLEPIQAYSIGNQPSNRVDAIGVDAAISTELPREGSVLRGEPTDQQADVEQATAVTDAGPNPVNLHPDTQASIDDDPRVAEPRKRKLTLRTYVTRYTKKLVRVSGHRTGLDAQQKHTQLLEQYHLELHQIEAQLAARSDGT